MNIRTIISKEGNNFVNSDRFTETINSDGSKTIIDNENGYIIYYTEKDVCRY